jgi:hypothetical protein
VTDQVSRPYKTAGKIIVLFILICTVLRYSRQVDDSELHSSKHCWKRRHIWTW